MGRVRKRLPTPEEPFFTEWRAALTAQGAELKALEARLKALDDRIERAVHDVRSVRGYVSKKLALYEDEMEEQDEGPSLPAPLRGRA